MDIGILGRLLIGLGVGLTVLGFIFLGFSRVPILKNLGKLPGDIVVQNGNFTCFAPIFSMIILSVLASLILNIAAWLLSR